MSATTLPMAGRNQQLTERVLELALAERFKAPEYAFMPQVRNGTGYQRTTRTADAVAMSLWPSRGIELHGFEIKISRSDWLHELKQPEKADEICRFCDRWWVVVGNAEIVQPGELPANWGLLVPKGKKLAVKVEAPKLEAQPITKLFLAGLLRKASEVIIDDSALKAARADSYEKGLEAGMSNAQSNNSIKVREYDRLLEKVKEFEAASGIDLEHGWHAGSIGQVVMEMVNRPRRSANAYAAELGRLLSQANQIADSIKHTIARSHTEEFAEYII